MGKAVHVAAGRERYVIRRFVRNVWQKQGFRQLAQEYCAHLPPLAEAQRLSILEYRARMMTPDAQRVSKRLLQRLLCLANWSWGKHPMISGSVDVFHWFAILRHASHPLQAVDQAARSSSLALVQYVDKVLQGLRAGLPVSSAIQPRKRLSSLVTEALRDLKRHITNNWGEELTHAQSCLERLQEARMDPKHLSPEQGLIVDSNIAHFEHTVQRLQQPSKPARASSVRVVEKSWPPASSEVDQYCGRYRQEPPRDGPFALFGFAPEPRSRATGRALR